MVGAGLSGMAAAYTLARAGVRVLVLERGDYPGAKNVMGGVLYRRPTEEVFPGFAAGAPVERRVVRQEVWLMTEDAVTALSYGSDAWNAEVNAWTVLRARFDQWLGERCRQAGVRLVTETTVTDLLLEGRRVVGVRTSRPDGDLRADVVVVAQGANRLLTEKAGLAPPLDPRAMAVAVKQVIGLPRETIEERFQLGPEEGVTIEMVGWPTRGLMGLAFLYTNKESLSLGVGVMVHRLAAAKINPGDLLDGLKEHPRLRPLLAGGEPREFTAHLIPEGGLHHVPPLYGDGFVVVGDAAMLCNALHREGSNLALISGRLAAEAILEARARGDYSAAALSGYRRRLERSFVLRDLHKYRNASRFFDDHPQFFHLYPELLSRAAREMLTVDLTPKREKQARVMRLVRAARPAWRIALDMARGWRALR